MKALGFAITSTLSCLTCRLLNYKKCGSRLVGTILRMEPSAYLLLRGPHGVPSINLLHDPLCPAHAIRYGSYGSGNPRSAVVLRQFTSRQNRGGDQQHALATFVHARSLAFSPYIRHNAAGAWMDAPQNANRCIGAEQPDALLLGDKGRKQGLKTTG